MKLFFGTLNWSSSLVTIFLLSGFFLLRGIEDPLITTFALVALWAATFATEPDKAKAQALGLSTAVITRYGRIVAVMPALIAGVISIYLRWWFALVITALILAWKLTCWKAKAKTMTVEDLLADTPGNDSFGHFPASLEGQLVYRPLVRGWFIGWVVLGIAAVANAFISSTWPENGPNIGNMLMTMGILAMATVVQHLDSLANFVTLGGSQSTWARHVIIASLVSPAASLLGVGLSWLIVGKPIWLIAAFGFLVPALVVSVELFSWKTVYMPVLIAAATAAIFVLRMKEMLDGVPMMLAAAVTYVLWAVLLPVNVRRVNPYASGLKKWLGIKT